MLNVLIGVCLAYVISLFAVAFWAERASMRGRANWLRSPMIYTLSLSIYCTGWTFYGAVGYAARSGLEFVTIYLGANPSCYSAAATPPPANPFPIAIWQGSWCRSWRRHHRVLRCCPSVARARRSRHRIRGGCCARHWASLFAPPHCHPRCSIGSAG